MGGGPISFVLRETIPRISVLEVLHAGITEDLRDDRRGRDGETVGVAVGDADLWEVAFRQREVIDQNQVGHDGEARDSATHGPTIGIRQPSTIDDVMAGPSQRHDRARREDRTVREPTLRLG